MKKFTILSQILLAVLLLAALPCRAAGGPPQQENRFLFLIDAARAMRGYSNAIEQSVVELIGTEMRGEFRKGDTIGMWTYNDKLHTEFPMQVWSPANKYSIATELMVDLRSQRFEKQARLERAMPALNQVIKTSQRITIILFSDGAGMIQGTPFDKEINALQKKYARELKLAHQPFVTVLAARNGAVFDYTINYPGVIAIPHTATPLEVVETNAPVAVVAKPVTNAPAKPKHRPSIIMSHSTNVVQAAAPAPTPPKAPVPVAQPPAKPAPTPTPAVKPPVTPAPPAAKVSTPAPPVTKTFAPQPVVPVAKVAPVSPPPATPPPKVAAAPPPVAPKAAPAPVAKPAPVATPAPAPVVKPVVAAAPPVQTTQPVPQPVITPQMPPMAVNNTPAQEAPPAKVAANEQQPSITPVPNAAVATASPAGGTQLRLFVVAFASLIIAVALVVFLIRRSRGAPQASLISQSIDRPR